MKKSIKCPECNSTDVIRIVYGLPPASLAEQADRGEIILGGCELDFSNPDWHCKKCGYDFKCPNSMI
ncbi:hypothetical protein ACFL1L_01995 [Thermoplasmatota archaeon]